MHVGVSSFSSWCSGPVRLQTVSPFAWTSSLSLSADSYGFLPGEWKWEKRCLCYLRERKTQHKHMTMFRYGSTLPAGEIKCAFLFSGKRPHAAGAADGETGAAAAAIMLHQNVIKRRSISNIRLILYHQTLIPTWQRVKWRLQSIEQIIGLNWGALWKKRRPAPLMKTIRPTGVFESYFLAPILLFTPNPQWSAG